MTARDDLKKLRIAVLFGGQSAERDVSIASSQTILAALHHGGYSPLAIDTGEAGWWLRLDEIDLAFNIQHGPGGEDGVTQGLLEAMGVVGTGSAVLGSALAMDKLRSKRLWLSAGLPTADFATIDEATDADALLRQWGQAFIKPAREGSSVGMSRVSSVDEFTVAVAEASRFDDVVMAECFIDGPEYTVGVLGDRALPAIRIEAARDFYDYEAKYHADSTRYHVPCGLNAQEERALQTLALRAYEVLGCSIWGRVDLMRMPSGEFMLLEANTIPGMTDHSLVPMAAEAAGLSLLQLIEEIMERSWQRGLATSGRQR